MNGLHRKTSFSRLLFPLPLHRAIYYKTHCNFRHLQPYTHRPCRGHFGLICFQHRVRRRYIQLPYAFKYKKAGVPPTPLLRIFPSQKPDIPTSCFLPILLIAKMSRFLPPSLLPFEVPLFQALGYEIPEPDQRGYLSHEVQAFMMSFKSVTGQTAWSFYDQTLQDHREGVKEMVDTFLEFKRKGQLYWPAENTSPWNLKYPEDRPRYFARFNGSYNKANR